VLPQIGSQQQTTVQPMKQRKSLNREARHRQLVKIMDENAKFLKRL
jgi:hypothetical protein